MKLNWTKREFETYVLLYAAHCNFIEDKEESDYILSKVDEQTFNKIHTEVVVDNETENLDKIQEYLKENDYSEEDKESLIRDIKNVFFADGSVDVLERKVFSILKKILR
jgi:hypothetical protein